MIPGLHSFSENSISELSPEYSNAVLSPFFNLVNDFSQKRIFLMETSVITEGASSWRINFDGGRAPPPVVGHTFNGVTSGATGVIYSVTLTSGSWFGSNAAGYIIFTDWNETSFINDESLRDGDLTFASADGVEFDGGLLPDSTNIRMSDCGFRASTTYYEPRLENALNFQTSMFSGKQFSGRKKSGSGAIVINNGDGNFDSLLGSAWDNKDITIKMGAQGFNESEFGTIFIGKAEQIEWDEQEITVRLRDHVVVLEDNVQDNLFVLADGVNIQGKPKPLTYGKCLNVTPVLVSTANASALVYQVHDDAISGIDNVYLAGASTQSFTVNASAGTFSLSISPGDSQVTCDVKGDATDTGYVDTTSDIIKRILKSKAGLSDTDLDLNTFNRVNALNTATVGIYIDSETNTAQVLDKLVKSIGGYWGYDRLGKVVIGIITEPGTAYKSYMADDITFIKKVATPLPIWKTDSHYQRVWTTQSRDSLAGIVQTDEDRVQFLAEESRRVNIISSTVLATHPLAEIKHIEGYMDLKADASTEAQRQQDLYGPDRTTYQVGIRNLTYDLTVGKVISITHPRFGLDTGKSFVLLGFSEDTASDSATLTLWG